MAGTPASCVCEPRRSWRSAAASSRMRCARLSRACAACAMRSSTARPSSAGSKPWRGRPASSSRSSRRAPSKHGRRRPRRLHARRQARRNRYPSGCSTGSPGGCRPTARSGRSQAAGRARPSARRSRRRATRSKCWPPAKEPASAPRAACRIAIGPPASRWRAGSPRRNLTPGGRSRRSSSVRLRASSTSNCCRAGCGRTS